MQFESHSKEYDLTNERKSRQISHWTTMYCKTGHTGGAIIENDLKYILVKLYKQLWGRAEGMLFPLEKQIDFI